MAWDLDTAKLYLGIQDDSQDAQVQQAMDIVLDSVERYLGRGLLLTRETIELEHVYSDRLHLPRYPINQVLKVDGEDMDSTWTVHLSGGWIQLPHKRYFDLITIEYEGGYGVLPATLERVMYEILNNLWAATDAVTGGPADDGLSAQPGEGSGEASRVTIQDFGSVTVDRGQGISGEGAAMATRQVLTWGWLNPWAATLELFRSESGAGVGVA